MKFYDFEVQTMVGKNVKMSDFKGKVVLVVNTASKCGYTKQFKGLEELYKKYSSDGLVILGFPCNQFGGQDPNSNEEIASFCQKNYGVSFPMFAKINVNGKEAHPLFQYLKKEKQGVLGTEAIKWNFTKFLIGKNGDVMDRFASSFTPEELDPIIKKELTK